MAEFIPTVRVETEHQREAVILTAAGVLDSVTYRGLRDTVIKAALDEPRAVIVDVDSLAVPSDSAWSVFTSARWHVSTWPGIPILICCKDFERRRGIERCGVARYVPVHPTRESALDAAPVLTVGRRRRAQTELPARGISVSLARALIGRWVDGWAQGDLIPVAGTVATVFIENVLDHTDSAPVLIVESYRDAVTVAVEDSSPVLPGRLETADSGTAVLSGLAIVAALCRAWGSTPTSSGKTVWATVGHENQP